MSVYPAVSCYPHTSNMHVLIMIMIVPTSVDPNELCVNGMSFSQRQSPFANAALVVSVEPGDVGITGPHDDPLLGVAWQQEIERKAAIMGKNATSMRSTPRDMTINLLYCRC